MERHLLVTVSEQQSAMYGVRFVGNFFSNKEGLKITLFYTAPRPPAVWEGEKEYHIESLRQAKADEYKAKGRKAFETAKKALSASGFSENQIDTKFRFRGFTKVDDIILEGADGLYDAVVLGRRGLSRLEEAFDESVTRELLKKKWNFPLWVCRRPDLKRKNVLVCVDGSDASYRMVDHVGFILGREKKTRVTLLLVKRDKKATGESTDTIFSKAGEHLLKNGFPEEMMETKVLESSNAARSILKEALGGGFAALAVGRTGTGQGLLKKLFVGSVCDTVFRELEGSALWISY
jgi:nucleotide-binding universal stress UspA family protein